MATAQIENDSDGSEEEDNTLSPGNKLLLHSRNGNISKITQLLTSHTDIGSYVNCKGTLPYYRTWVLFF